MQQFVDRDVLLDGSQRHARRADDLIHPEVPEERLVARIVDARDRARTVEVVLGHLACDEVVLIIASDGGHDGGAVGTGLLKVRALATITIDHDGSEFVSDPARVLGVLLHEDHLVALGEQFLGQIEADATSPDDDDEHAH